MRKLKHGNSFQFSQIVLWLFTCWLFIYFCFYQVILIWKRMSISRNIPDTPSTTLSKVQWSIFFFLWALDKEKRLMRIPSGDSNLVQSVPAGCRWVGNFVRSSAQIEMLNSLLPLLPFCNVQAYFITSLPWQKIFLVPLFDLAWLSSTIVTVAKGSCSLPLLKVISTLEVKAWRRF